MRLRCWLGPSRGGPQGLLSQLASSSYYGLVWALSCMGMVRGSEWHQQRRRRKTLLRQLQLLRVHSSCCPLLSQLFLFLSLSLRSTHPLLARCRSCCLLHLPPDKGVCSCCCPLCPLAPLHLICMWGVRDAAHSTLHLRNIRLVCSRLGTHQSSPSPRHLRRELCDSFSALDSAGSFLSMSIFLCKCPGSLLLLLKGVARV